MACAVKYTEKITVYKGTTGDYGEFRILFIYLFLVVFNYHKDF